MKGKRKVHFAQQSWRFYEKVYKYSNFLLKDLHISKNSHNFAKILGKMRDDFIGHIVNKAVEDAAPKDLLMIADFPQYDPTYISKLLSAAADEGRLVRLSGGIFMKPAATKYGLATPSMSQIAEAIAERDHVQILPVGETAENMFGLSEQVPMKTVFLTSGSARAIHIGGRELQFRRGVPRNFAYKDKNLAAFCQALKSIGDGNLTDEQMTVVYSVMKHYAGNQEAVEDIQKMPQWIRKLLLNVLKNIERL